MLNLSYLTESLFSTSLDSCALSLLLSLLVGVVCNICNALPMPFLWLEYLWLVCLENPHRPSPALLLSITGTLLGVLEPMHIHWSMATLRES